MVKVYCELKKRKHFDWCCIFVRIFQLYKSVHLLEQRHLQEISDHEMVFNMAPSSKFDTFQFGLHAKESYCFIAMNACGT